MKVAFLFPGQGSQYVGMGQDLVVTYPEAHDVLRQGSEALGMDLSDLCFAGPEECLMETENTQPAILGVSIAVAHVLKRHGITPDVAAGLSLGEYSALVLAGSLDLADAFVLVKERGRFMQEAVPLGKGAMAAILGLDREQVERVCLEASHAGIVEPANFNCPGQVVVSGEVSAIDKAVEVAKKMGAKRAKRLPVSAPFHSSLMVPAGVRLARLLEGIEVSDPRIPVISNVGGTYLKGSPDIKERLVKQVSSPVMWEDTIRRMFQDGVRLFLEVGPGNALTGFTKRICPEGKALSVRDRETLAKALECYMGVC